MPALVTRWPSLVGQSPLPSLWQETPWHTCPGIGPPHVGPRCPGHRCPWFPSSWGQSVPSLTQVSGPHTGKWARQSLTGSPSTAHPHWALVLHAAEPPHTHQANKPTGTCLTWDHRATHSPASLDLAHPNAQAWGCGRGRDTARATGPSPGLAGSASFSRARPPPSQAFAPPCEGRMVKPARELPPSTWGGIAFSLFPSPAPRAQHSPVGDQGLTRPPVP